MRFKAKKKKKKRILIFYITIGIMSYLITYNYLNITKRIVKNNEKVLYKLGLNDYKILNIKTSKIKSLLYEGLNYSLEEPRVAKSINVNSDPQIYIYNTHQNENYDTKLFNAYNISYTVETASYLLKDNLKIYNINSVVETKSISSYLNTNNLSYKDSYKASRIFIKEAMDTYPNIKYFVDIHRDSVAKERTTATIGNKTYAKVLFVIGENNPNYLKNLELANKINSKIDDNITNGIIKKSGSKVNGIYNQDLNENIILIEIGGKDNTIEEVNNTTKVLAKAIYESIGDKDE